MEAALQTDATLFGDPLPAMPVLTSIRRVKQRKRHRYKVPFHRPEYSAMVAKPVTQRELQFNKGARKAVAEEWTKLRAVGEIDSKTKKIIVKSIRYYYRPNDVTNLVGDYSKARKLLKWRPKTNFKQLVKLMVDNDIKEYFQQKLQYNNHL